MNNEADCSVPCLRCGGTEKRLITEKRVATISPVRIVCAGCGRFIGWGAPNTGNLIAPSKTAIPLPTGQSPATLATDPLNPLEAGSTSIHPSLITPPEAWPYTSKRLDLEWVPNAPFWSAPVIRFGTTWFYRVTPTVVAWLEAAGRQLEDAVVAGTAGRDQLEVYLAVMADVWRFADAVFDPAELAAARSVPAKLPDVPYLPAA